MKRPKNGRRKPGPEPKKPATPEFTREEWAELYYAVEYKARLIKEGFYGPDGQDGVCNAEWSAQLQGICEKIVNAGIQV